MGEVGQGTAKQGEAMRGGLELRRRERLARGIMRDACVSHGEAWVGVFCDETSHGAHVWRDAFFLSFVLTFGRMRTLQSYVSYFTSVETAV